MYLLLCSGKYIICTNYTSRQVFTCYISLVYCSGVYHLNFSGRVHMQQCDSRVGIHDVPSLNNCIDTSEI